jgi:SAM-dependent methyltransferase
MARAREFWDARAEEDAFFFVDNRLEYGAPDLERFWAEGERDLATLLAVGGVAITPDDDVVEIGCGVGRLTRALARSARSVRALDVSPRMIELAREHNPALPGVTWIVGDGVSLAGIDDASADVCLSHVVFQHIADPEVTLGYIREMGRVLRPGGWAVFQVSNDPGVHAPLRGPGALRIRVLSALGRAPRGQGHPDWRGSAVSLDGLRAAAADGGMDVEHLDGAGTQYCVAVTRKRAS